MMIDPRKEAFDAARAADEDGILVLDDINKINAVLDLLQMPRLELPLAKVAEAGGPDLLGDDGIHLIMQFEGCARLRKDGKVQSYPDPGTGGKPWTIGWGSTYDFDGRRVQPGLVWTKEQCDRKLKMDLVRYANDVARAIGDTPTSQAQFDALVSFHYNTGAIGRATLTKKHKRGDYAGAAAQFARWNRAGGRAMRGLTRRRASEAALYRSGM